ncbi:MAG: LysM peptidoglycan-binding domain-containing protein [bacterium]|nr:LysM peptidoglycan-binding domain-containing protein [bacterium]
MNANTAVYGNCHFHTAYSRDELRKKRNLQRKRLQETKRRLFFVTVSLALIMTLGIVFGGFLSNANASWTSGQPQEHKYFTQHTISHDETLWEIASRYADSHYDGISDYIDEVKEMNHIDDIDEIRAGNVLLLPYYSAEPLR